jgi:hypothetical protein
VIKQPVTDFQTFAQIANLMWKTCIEKGITGKRNEEESMIPHPDSIEVFMKIIWTSLWAKRTASTCLWIRSAGPKVICPY